MAFGRRCVAAHDWGTAGAVWAAIADATWAAAGSAARAVVWSTTDPAGPGSAEPPVWDAACDAAADAAGVLAWVAVRDAARRHAAAWRCASTTLLLPRLAPVVPVAAWVPVTPIHHHRSSGGAGPDLPATHPPSPVGLGGGHGRVCRVCTAEAGRARRETTCTAAASILVSGDQGMGSSTSSATERRDSSPVVETRPDAAVVPAADDMEEPDALAEADDPSESDDMWQLAWETAVRCSHRRVLRYRPRPTTSWIA